MNHAGAFREDARAGVAGHVHFHAGAHKGAFGTEQGHGLTLHVRAHERAVGVVVFEERDQRGGDGHHLARRNVHEGDFLTGGHEHVVAHAGGDVVVHKTAVGIDGGVGLRNDMARFAGSVEVHELVGHVAVADDAVRRLDEAVVVHLGVGRQGDDQANVRAFGRFDGADAAIVRHMDVSDFKTGAFAGQTAGAQSGKAALVRDFREGVGLVHELRQLRGAEEFLEHGGHGLRIDQVVGHERRHFLNAHPFLDGAFHAHEADAVLVFHQLAHETHAAVAEMVDVVGGAVAVLQLDKHLDGVKDVVVGKGAQVGVIGLVEALVELVAAHGRQVVVVAVAEQVVEERRGDFRGRRGARTQAAVDLFLRLFHGGRLVLHQGVADGGRGVGAAGMQRGNGREPGFTARIKEAGGDFVGGFGEDFTGGVVDQIFGKEQAERRFGGHFDLFDAGGFHLAPRALGDGLAGLHQHVALLVDDVGKGGFLAVQLRIEVPRDAAVILKLVDFFLVEAVQDFGLAHAHGFEQDRGRHLAAAVDAHVEDILVVEVEVEPRAAHGDDAAGVEHLAAGMRLAAVVLEDDAGGTL